MERLTKTEIFATTCYVASIVFAIVLAASFSGCAAPCDNTFGSCITIEDEAPEPEPCDAEYEDDCEEPGYVTCLPRERYLLQLANERQYGYDTGFTDGKFAGIEEARYETCDDRYDEGFFDGKRYFRDRCQVLIDEYYDDVETGEVCFTEIEYKTQLWSAYTQGLDEAVCHDDDSDGHGKGHTK